MTPRNILFTAAALAISAAAIACLLPAPPTDLIIWAVAIGIAGGVAILAAGALIVAADLWILPRFPAARWKRPWCALQGCVSDEREAGDDEPGDACQRCGLPLRPLEDHLP